MKLWYKEPAVQWTQALPVGNGRLGGMVFGGVTEETIALNEDTLWSGYPREYTKDTKAPYAQIVALTKAGQYSQAQTLFEQEMSGGWTQSYLPAGDLLIHMDHDQAVTEYQRQLSLEDAVATTSYQVDGVGYTRRVFASHPDGVLAVWLACDTPNRLTFELGLQSQLVHTVVTQGEQVVLTGTAPAYVEPSYSDALKEPVQYAKEGEPAGMAFAIVAKVLCQEGTVGTCSQRLSVQGATQALILLDIRTGYAGRDTMPYRTGEELAALCQENLQQAQHRRAQALLERHTADYQTYYQRVRFSLGEPQEDTVPTNQRLLDFSVRQQDDKLYELLFQYGRYLLISSSRPGTQPANLQGIWNTHLRAPWSSNYTLNINLPMNYWPAFPCNLAEMNQPLVELIRELVEPGQKTARAFYGAEGFAVHHNTDLWRLTSPVGNQVAGSTVYAFWNGAGGWLCQHLFTQYEYTQDKTFLRDTAYPIMREAARFYLSILTEDEKGYLAVLPSTSPENTFLYKGGICSLAQGATMTNAIVRELFSNCIASCEILGEDEAFAQTLQQAFDRLPPYQIGSRGQLLEWDKEYPEAEPDHRHNSHLYPLHPGVEFTRESTPELAEACAQTLRLRGEEGTSWSLGWRTNLWARLGQGEPALRMLWQQLRLVEEDGVVMTGGGSYSNLLSAHPPFQIDGNFGATAGIAEMLLQSRPGGIWVLPALPEEWSEGTIRGLQGKGQLTVDITWDKTQAEVTVCSPKAQSIQVTVGDQQYQLTLAENQPVRCVYSR